MGVGQGGARSRLPLYGRNTAGSNRCRRKYPPEIVAELDGIEERLGEFEHLCEDECTDEVMAEVARLELPNLRSASSPTKPPGSKAGATAFRLFEVPCRHDSALA